MNLQYERNIKLLDSLESRGRLRDILTDPIFIAAMAVIQEDCRVTQMDLDKLLDSVIARRTSFHAGVSEVCEKLRSLSRKDNSGGLTQHEDEPFNYLTPETP
jgi:hypothetical protein